MLTEEQFIDQLEKNTGLSFSDGDFGFIMGTHTPFMQTKGMTSASNKSGFIVWNRLKDGTSRTLQLIPGDNTLEIISIWLQPNIDEKNKVEMISKIMGAFPIVTAE